MASADLGNGLKLSLDWGTDRRLASRLFTAAGVDIWHVGYSYDADDNITAITDLVPAVEQRRLRVRQRRPADADGRRRRRLLGQCNMQTETDALALAAQWIAQLATGSIATGAATIAIAAVGFAMLAGRMDLRRGASVIIGCFILFAAPAMARSFMQWAGAGETDRTAAYQPSSLPTTPSGPPVSQPFDPYAGASLIR